MVTTNSHWINTIFTSHHCLMFVETCQFLIESFSIVLSMEYWRNYWKLFSSFLNDLLLQNQSDAASYRSNILRRCSWNSSSLYFTLQQIKILVDPLFVSESLGENGVVYSPCSNPKMLKTCICIQRTIVYCSRVWKNSLYQHHRLC